MAEVFKSVVSAGVGTSSASVYTCPASTTTVVIGCMLANRASPLTTINVDVTLAKSGGATVNVVKNVQVFTGASLSLAGENNKIVLEAGDVLSVQSDTATSVDVTMSILEIS